MGLNIKDIAAPSSGQAWDPQVGDQIVGTVTLCKLMTPKPNYNKTALEREMRIDLTDDQGGVTTVWAVVDTDVEGNGYPSRLAKAIAAAVRASGAEELEEGGRLALVRIQDGEPPQKGFSAPKDYAAQYSPPTNGVNLSALMGGQPEPPVQPAGTAFVNPVAAQAPTAPDARVMPVADPFAGLMGQPMPVAPSHPQVLAEHRERAAAIFGLDASALAAVTPAGMAQLVKDKGVANGDALQMLTTLYGDHTIALAAVATAYGQPQAAPAADPLAALLGG